MPARILTLDIETSPNVADVWGLWNQNISIKQLRKSTNVISFAAKWLGEKKVSFFSEYHTPDVMVEAAWQLVDAADIVVHYNGVSFDMKHLNREFAEADLNPPSPVFQVDLLKVVKQNFNFPSNKLEYVSRALGLEGKLQHTGHQLWTDCLGDDEERKAAAWKLMRRYNCQDVRLTEKLYLRLLPWIKHPNLSLWSGVSGCPNCGSDAKQSRGVAYTAVASYQQFVCTSCGKWYRGAKAIPETATDYRGIA